MATTTTAAAETAVWSGFDAVLAEFDAAHDAWLSGTVTREAFLVYVTARKAALLRVPDFAGYLTALGIA